jgi:AAA ATPase domain/AAA domain/Protein of unknown function (DUF3696)
LSSSRFNINLVEELTLGNFKCFSTPQKFPLRPITLLYGPNGAGKSSVIQALSWLPELSSGTWPQNFGRFVRNHDQQSDLTFGVKISLANETFMPPDSDSFPLRMRHQIARQVATFAFQAQLTGRNPVSIVGDQDAFPHLRSLARVPLVSGSNLTINEIQFLELRHWFGEPIVTTESFGERKSRLQIAKFNKEHPIIPLLLTLSRELALHRVRNRIVAVGESVLGPLESALRDFDPSTITPDDLFRAASAVEETIFFDAYRLPIRADLSEQDRDITWVSIEESDRVDFRIPFVGIPQKSNPDGNEIREFVLDNFRLCTILLVNFLSDLDELMLGYFCPFWQTVQVGALRSIPVGEFLLTDPDDRRRYAPDWHLSTPLDGIQRQIESVNDWLESLGRRDTAYRFLTSRLDSVERIEGEEPSKEQHVRFKGILDVQRNVIVPLSDTGTGFSQLLPIILAAFSGDGELVAIQQPELHLHPALQSELGDLFIARALGQRFDEEKWEGTNQFVLETHSEHLLLRIMRRIRETSRGTLPGHIPPVYPDDISILYIDNAAGETVVRPMPLSDDGQLLYDWPGGFFEEGLRELLI